VPDRLACVVRVGLSAAGGVWWDGEAWFWVMTVDGRSVGGQAPTREVAEQSVRDAEDGHPGGRRLKIVQ
jgi:hypothetical protein